MKTKSWKEHKNKLMKDKVFANELKNIEPEFELARQVVKLRIERKMTQTELAKKAGTHQVVVSRIENGTANPTIDSLEKISKALGKKLEIKLT